MTGSPALLASVRRHPGTRCLALVVGVWGCLGWASWAGAAPPAAARQPSAAPAGPAKDDPAIAKRAFDTLMRANEAADALKAADIAQRYGINAFDICFGGPMAFPSPKDHPIQPAVPASTGAG